MIQYIKIIISKKCLTSGKKIDRNYERGEKEKRDELIIWKTQKLPPRNNKSYLHNLTVW